MTKENMNEEKLGLGVWTSFDLHLFNEGNHFHLYNKLGSRSFKQNGKEGIYFSVWAPNAQSVSVMGGFNDWNKSSHYMNKLTENSGIWEIFISEAKVGYSYKYHIVSKFNNYSTDKADPYAFQAETPPHTGSVIWDKEYEWKDANWMKTRKENNDLNAPMSIYEVHLDSWAKKVEEENRSLTYKELSQELVDYVKKMGFTHIEFMPIMEYPFDPSWGYQITGYFAPTSRFGPPEDMKYLIDVFHQNGIGVIVDWVPSHFPLDGHGLSYFDGTHLYEHADQRKGFHPDWKSGIFNYGRHEVKSFLISNALYWLDKFHIDGLRVDAVASMLYLDYSREEGEWIPNEYGGNENLEAIAFLRQFNEVVYREFPDVQTIAEESTSWPMVSRPLYIGGLGFGLKWDMGWMHDTLHYMALDPIHRKFHHNELTFRMMYAFHENFVLSLSHDEVVHGKGSLIRKMPGDDWQRFANLRLLFAYMYSQPGKKLIFMGGEFGQWSEWYFRVSLDWHLLNEHLHEGLRQSVQDLNHLYKNEHAFYDQEFHPDGFEWVDCNDSEQSVVSFLRKAKEETTHILAAFNFTPLPRHSYRIGVPFSGEWQIIFNSDAPKYGGSGVENRQSVHTEEIEFHGHPYSFEISIPPLGALFLKISPIIEKEEKQIEE